MTFSYGFDDEIIQIICRSQARTMLSGILLARWRRPVASSEALDLLHWAMWAVTYQRIAMAIKMASFAGVFVDCCLYACCPGSRWGVTEQVVARCQHPVASGVFVDMLHQAMLSVLLVAPPWPSKRPADEVHLFATTAFFVCCNRSLRPCYGQLK
jgi:hypothetical protein